MKNKYFQLKSKLDKIIKDFSFKENIDFVNTIQVIYGKNYNNPKRYFKIGNLKIGNDTIIFNMGSAYKCPADKLGLCKLSDKCYAKKAENQYWLNTTHYRELSGEFWKKVVKNNAYEHFAGIIRDIVENRNKTAMHKLNFLRLNESGDFYGQKDVDFLVKICKILAITLPNFVIYTYTARNDLNFSEVLKQPNLVINGSGFMIDNNFNTYLYNDEISKNDKICKGSCAVCNYCKVKKGYNIKIKLH